MDSFPSVSIKLILCLSGPGASKTTFLRFLRSSALSTGGILLLAPTYGTLVCDGMLREFQSKS
jgi:hypothetical protein